MNILFVHQNFPGQYRHLAPALAAQGHRVLAMSMNAQPPLPGVQAVPYGVARGTGKDTHPLAAEFETKVLRGEAAASTALGLKQYGFTPDVICAHPGWGESLFLKDVWPKARLLAFLEYYYSYSGADVGFDPEFRHDSLADAARVRVKNANNLLALEAMDAGLAPTGWQKAQFPAWARPGIEVIHDGIDTAAVAPNASATLLSEQAGLRLAAGDEVVTFVSRNLEPYRGFHIFMRALPAILERRKNARIVIVGAEGPGYGAAAPGGESWRQLLMKEVGDRLDLSRVHFVGKVPYNIFLAILQVSAAHVYLTYPFVLSWSMLEAMSAGCLVIGSRTPPVEEVIRDGDNGVLVDFFDVQALADTVVEALRQPERFRQIRARARDTIVKQYDLHGVCLPRHLALVARLATQDDKKDIK